MHLDYSGTTLKKAQRIAVVVFAIKINTSCFIARLPKRKPEKAINSTVKALGQKSVSFIDMQCLVGFLLFCSQAVRLGRVFIRRLWNGINYFPRVRPRTTLRKIEV